MFDTPKELLDQIRLGEDSTLELKEIVFSGEHVSGPHRDSMADELAAMANTWSGVFVLGIEDKTRGILGIPVARLDAVETWIRSICNDLIVPPLICRIKKLLLPLAQGSDRAIIRIDLARSLFVHRSPGDYFQRIGSSESQMSPDLLARLFQQRSQARLIRFDEQVMAEVPAEALDRLLWQRFTTALSPKGDREFLTKMKLLVEDDEGQLHPSVGGGLLATRNPTEWLPNAFIQAVAYRGTERNAEFQIDAKDYKGPLDEQIREACRFVARNMLIAATKAPARRDLPQYSMSAVFEAIVNAVAHRDYSIHVSKIRLHLFHDRLELFSPGTIPNSMTIESLPLRQAARNELIASLLARCPLSLEGLQSERGFLMDKRGEGVPIILTESERLSGRRPEYRLIDDSELMLTIFAANGKG
ncbi:MAG: ATP-binding protein [Spirochaetota bacterium]